MLLMMITLHIKNNATSQTAVFQVNLGQPVLLSILPLLVPEENSAHTLPVSQPAVSKH